jgi:GrpB-like predicted nucleotidyltransferase (UPF0157 family)
MNVNGDRVRHHQWMKSQKPVLVPYRFEWETEAAQLISILHAQLGDSAARIEHIGSTAIPGMTSKDVIDLQVSVIDLESATLTFEGPLSARGFVQSPFRTDHVPAGLDDDPADWTKRLWTRRDAASSSVNLHVRKVGSPNERLALLFRDWFRSHPAATPAYGTIKESITAVTCDTNGYAEMKDPVVDLVFVAAEAWARSANWKV